MKTLTHILFVSLLSSSLALAEEAALPTAEPEASGGQVVSDLPAASGSSTSSNAKLSILYSTSKAGKFEAAEENYTLSGEDEFTGGAPGLAMEYVQRKNDSVGFSAGLAYESSRKMTGFSYDWVEGNQAGSASGTYAQARTLSLILPAANMNYSFGASGIYGFGGLNYSLPSFSTTGSDNLKSKFGWQIGAGYEASKKVDVDAIFQTVNMKYSDRSNLNWTSYKMQGFSLRVGYRI